MLAPRDHDRCAPHLVEDPGLADRVGLAQDQLGLVGVGNEDVGVRQHDLQTAEIIAGAGRRHVEQRDRARRRATANRSASSWRIELGQDQEIADVQHAGAECEHWSRSAATNPGLAPTEWMNRRSSPRTLTINVWLVASVGVDLQRIARRPVVTRVSVANRPKMSSPTRAQIAALTPSRARSTAVLAAPPPILRTS